MRQIVATVLTVETIVIVDTGVMNLTDETNVTEMVVTVVMDARQM